MRIDHRHGHLLTGGEWGDDLVPHTTPSPANEAIAAMGQSCLADRANAGRIEGSHARAARDVMAIKGSAIGGARPCSRGPIPAIFGIEDAVFKVVFSPYFSEVCNHSDLTRTFRELNYLLKANQRGLRCGLLQS